MKSKIMEKYKSLPVQKIQIHSRAGIIQYQDLLQNFSPNSGACRLKKNLNGQDKSARLCYDNLKSSLLDCINSGS